MEHDIVIPGNWASVLLVLIIIALWGAGYAGFCMGVGEAEKEDERNGVEG
jgi:hypothetical protein